MLFRTIIAIGVTFLFFLATGVNYSFCSEIFPPEDAEIWDLSKMSSDQLKILEEKSKENSGKIILYVPSGYELNLNLNFKGSIISSKNNYIKIEFNKPIFFYPPESGDPFFSIDGENWGKIEELFSGIITLGQAIENSDNNEKTNFQLDFEINLREKE